jgi:hypothetical protein
MNSALRHDGAIKKLVYAALVAAIAAASCFPLVAVGQDIEYPRIEAKADRATATIGEMIACTLELRAKNLSGIVVRLPEEGPVFPAPPAGAPVKKATGDGEKAPDEHVPLYVVYGAVKEEDAERGEQRWLVKLSVAYFRPGNHLLPEIEMYDRQNVRIGYRQPSIEVKAVNPSGQFQEIEPPLSLGGNYTRLILLLIGAAVLGAGCFFLFRWWKSRRREPDLPPAVIPPIEIFMRETGALIRRRHIESGRVEEFVMELSRIFRKFVSALQGFDAMEMTGSEMLAAMHLSMPAGAFAEARADLWKMIELWDLAKFAEFSPSAETLNANFDLTVRLARKLAAGGG